MEINFMDVGCGDAIHIRFSGSDDKIHNVLIDGGMEKGDIYPRVLRRKLEKIMSQGEKIDLWIITHIDDDHIGGILRLIKDSTMLAKVDLSRTTFWFNYSIWDYDTGLRDTTKKSVRQAVLLRDYLIKNSNVISPVTDSLQPIDFWGAKFTILSPNDDDYKILLKEWENEEVKIKRRERSSQKKASKNDYDVKLEDFDLASEVKDDSSANASSIAFILDFNGKAVLFTADAYASVLSSALQKINCGNPIKFEIVQVPHHGSRYNISNQLLKLIDCSKFVITGDGFNKSSLPNKVTLAKILALNIDKNIEFYITQKNDITKTIFDVDTTHDINLNFPQADSNEIAFQL